MVARAVEQSQLQQAANNLASDTCSLIHTWFHLSQMCIIKRASSQR